MLMKKRLVLDHIMHGCMSYNLAYRIEQYFNCYEYGHILIQCQKNTKYGAYLSLYKTLECS